MLHILIFPKYKRIMIIIHTNNSDSTKWSERIGNSFSLVKIFVNINIVMNMFTTCNDVGWDSVVDVATCYRPHSPGIKSWWGWDFPQPSRPTLHPTQRPVQWVTRSFPGVKPPRCGINNPLTSSTVVKHRVELHLYSLSGPSWPITGCNLPFFLPFYKLMEIQKHINF